MTKKLSTKLFIWFEFKIKSRKSFFKHDPVNMISLKTTRVNDKTNLRIKLT
jgi:hypothetical protein